MKFSDNQLSYHQAMRDGLRIPAKKKDVSDEELIHLRKQGLSYRQISESIGGKLTTGAVLYRLSKAKHKEV